MHVIFANELLSDANNPSDLLKELHQERQREKVVAVKEADDVKQKKVAQIQLLADMKEDHGFSFKRNILSNIRSDDVLQVSAIT